MCSWIKNNRKFNLVVGPPEALIHDGSSSKNRIYRAESRFEIKVVVPDVYSVLNILPRLLLWRHVHKYHTFSVKYVGYPFCTPLLLPLMQRTRHLFRPVVEKKRYANNKKLFCFVSTPVIEMCSDFN
jgi:hypothetical protein